ncbi:MAG: hypothetical protein Q8P20_09690 [bacterium]|nr:hypothetical protein [bacterium]
MSTFNFKQFPLCSYSVDCNNKDIVVSGDIIKIHEPNIDFFLNKIKNSEYFSLTRHADWWWQRVLRAICKAIPLFDVTKDSINLTKQLKNKIASDISDASRNNAYSTSREVILENIEVTVKTHSDDLFFTVKAMNSERQHLVKLLTSKDEFLNAHSWRNFAGSGEIHRLFTENSDCHFIIIGPFYYENFGEKLSLDSFSFVEIHETRGCNKVGQTVNTISSLIKSIKDKKVICLFSAGSLSSVMIARLHELSMQTFLIDVGRALDPYYCHDDVLLKGPEWRWPAAWFGRPHNVKEWTNWTKAYKS